jgi:hypothetical protein
MMSWVHKTMDNLFLYRARKFTSVLNKEFAKTTYTTVCKVRNQSIHYITRIQRDTYLKGQWPFNPVTKMPNSIYTHLASTVFIYFCSPKQCKKSVSAFTLTMALIFVTGVFIEIICKFSYITVKLTIE